MHLRLNRLFALAASISSFVQPTMSHSWVEQLMLIAPNGTFVGEPGYPRGNVRRTTPGFSDVFMTYLLPPLEQAEQKILPNDNICMESQRTRNQTEDNPRLQAAPGAAVALRYQENGHVTLPQNQPGKPPHRGKVYVYGTTDPRPDDTLLSIHKVWNANGTGGDGRGILLSQQYFDDGRCYQINDGEISTHRQTAYPHEANKIMGANLWCQQDIALPANAPVGKPFTLYWVWDWPTAPGVDPGLPDGKPETYTTCMDVDINKDNKMDIVMKAADTGYDHDQPLDNAAIPSQMAELDRDIRIPDPVVSTTLATQATSSANPSLTTVTRVVTVTSLGCPSEQSSQPDANTSTTVRPVPTGAEPNQPVETYQVKAFRFHREGYQLPHTVSPTDAAYAEYERRRRSGEMTSHEESSDDINPPTYRSPRLSDHQRRRWFFS